MSEDILVIESRSVDLLERSNTVRPPRGAGGSFPGGTNARMVSLVLLSAVKHILYYTM